MFKKVIKIGILAGFLSLLLFILFKNSAFFYLKTKGVSVDGIDKLSIENRGEDYVVLGGDGKRVKMKFFDLNKEKFDNYFKEQSILLKGIFEPQLPPYPEFLTKETGCGKKYKPIQKQNDFGEYYLLYAGERFGYGVCVDDLIEYRASLGYFYCPKKEMGVQLEYFVPKNSEIDLINLTNSFKCK